MLEPTTVGLSSDAHARLRELQEHGTFKDMADAYRLAIAYGLAEGIEPRDLPEVRGGTIFNIGTLDPERMLYAAVAAVTRDDNVPVYRRMERLAEWGVLRLYHHLIESRESLVSLFKPGCSDSRSDQ